MTRASKRGWKYSLIMDVSRFPLVPGPSPMLVTHSKGVWLHTSDGRRILDAGGGAIVTILVTVGKR